jgi:Flp pilus assembly protein TadD
VVARAALLLLSLAVVVWLASAYPGARDESRAAAIEPAPGGRLAPADAARARALYTGALRRRPDTVAGPRLAALELAAGEPADAVARLRRIVAGEPDNVTAWTVLALALADRDPAGARAAEARRAALAPPVAPER